MRRIFYFIARISNYSTAIAITTSIVISVVSIAEFFILDLFLASVYELIINLLDIPQYYFLIGIIVLYLILTGFLSPVKIPALFKSMRTINKNIKGNKLNPNIGDEDLKKLYNYLTRLPVYNMLITLFLLLAGGAASFITAYFSLREYGGLFIDLLMEYIQISIILHGFITVITALIIYVLTDSITSPERATSYKELWQRNYFQRPKSYLGLRLKFNIVILLMLISLASFILLIMQRKLYVEITLSGFIIYFLSSILAAIIIIFLTSNSILRVFKDISRVASDITKGSKTNFRILPLEAEFADVEYLIMGMDKEIIEHRRNLEAKVEERTEELRIALADLKERDDMVQKQLDMAGSIQRGILPGKINDWNELKFSVKYYSMEKIGGDFYDVQYIGNNKIGVYIADVSGHGIPAALVTTMAKVSFGSAFLKYDSPKKIFRDVNQELLDHIKTQEYLTCFMIMIDDEYNITYSNASHQKAIIVRTNEGRIEHLDTGGLFIGAIEDARDTYEEKTTKLNYGDRLVLYTDGIPEAVNAEKNIYSNERFESIILQNKDMQLNDFTNSIIEDLQNFVSGSQIQDDITLLVIELEKDRAIDTIRTVKSLTDRKNYAEAVSLLGKELEEYPDNQKLLYYAAKTYFLMNDYDMVLEMINRYLKNETNNKYAYYLAGAAHFKKADYESAIDLFLKAVNIDSNFTNALLAVAMTYKETGNTEEARRFFERLKKVDEDNKIAEYELSALKS